MLPMFDLFYTSAHAPNLFPYEKPAVDLADAKKQARTEFFWFVDGSKDMRDFDFGVIPPPWEYHHTHIHLLYSQFGENFSAVFAPKEDLELVEHYYDRKYLRRYADSTNWKILKTNVEWNIDPNWCPNPFEPPYIYVFGNPWYSAVEMPTAEYHVPGATERKYCDEQVLTVQPNKAHWKILKEANWVVDYQWAPNPFEPPYIYVFGNPWYSAVEMPTAEYHVPGATERKYCDEKALTCAVDPSLWKYLKPEAIWKPDPNWAPNPFEPPYIYVFGNPWYSSVEMPTAEYHVPGATERKYVTDAIVTVEHKPEPTRWKTLRKEAEWDIDFTWAPNPFEPPYIYVFGNPWYSAIEMPTVEYFEPGATEYKYCDEKIVTVKKNSKYWKLLVENVDITTLAAWVPNPFEPAYIYVFGNQWYGAADMPTVEYRMPGGTEKKYVTDFAATLTPTRLNWTVPEEVNSGLIDFSWLPHPKEAPYVYHFSSEYQMSIGLLYTVPGATELKFETEVPILKRKIGARLNAGDNTGNIDKSIVRAVSMFFVDMNNKTSATRFDALKLRYPDIQKIRYMNGWLETIKRCVVRSETQKFWVISSENVYDNFSFEWHAQPWQNFMTHVFASQWQKWSDTFLINKNEFTRHAKWAKTLEEFPNLNFVKDQPVYRPDDVYDIYFVDHLNNGSTAVLDKMKKRYPDVKVARFADSYLATLRRLIATATTDYIWVTNSICDYSKFDFTWQPEPWQAKMLHVFSSDDQKFGDTFYIHVPTFKEQMDTIELLDWFTTVNYCTDQIVPRLPMDEVVYASDSLVDAVKAHDFNGPFTIFRHHSIANTAKFSPSVWRKKDRVLHTFSQSGSVTVVPRDAKQFIDTQMYDYPYILPHKEQFIRDSALDIVYISNGEPDAERWYNHLVKCVAKDRKIHWVKDVNGRAAAYKAAATVSTTPWFYAVFAKLEVNPEFNWDWQPDYLQEPKHYIFHAHNPVNGLEYGHMAVLAYNKALTLATVEYGLDFTLSQKHEVVPLLSATAHYNVSPIITWRTAFRECIKLCDTTDDVSAQRLLTWCTIAEGKNAKWSISGANDAREYYDSVNGNMEKLMLSFEWDWLNALFVEKYGAY